MLEQIEGCQIDLSDSRGFSGERCLSARGRLKHGGCHFQHATRHPRHSTPSHLLQYGHCNCYADQPDDLSSMGRHLHRAIAGQSHTHTHTRTMGYQSTGRAGAPSSSGHSFDGVRYLHQAVGHAVMWVVESLRYRVAHDHTALFTELYQSSLYLEHCTHARQPYGTLHGIANRSLPRCVHSSLSRIVKSHAYRHTLRGGPCTSVVHTRVR